MGYVEFTREMKRDYTILVPNMLPMHFEMIVQVLRNYGYRLDLLRSSGHKIADTGLKYCHNDACYPAILVIGQFIDALQSGKYDPLQNRADYVPDRRRMPGLQLYFPHP